MKFVNKQSLIGSWSRQARAVLAWVFTLNCIMVVVLLWPLWALLVTVDLVAWHSLAFLDHLERAVLPLTCGDVDLWIFPSLELLVHVEAEIAKSLIGVIYVVMACLAVLGTSRARNLLFGIGVIHVTVDCYLFLCRVSALTPLVFFIVWRTSLLQLGIFVLLLFVNLCLHLLSDSVPVWAFADHQIADVKHDLR